MMQVLDSWCGGFVFVYSTLKSGFAQWESFVAPYDSERHLRYRLHIDLLGYMLTWWIYYGCPSLVTSSTVK